MTASPKQLPELRRKLLDRMAGVEHELKIAYLNRQIYTELRDEIVRVAPTADATFLNSYAGLYVRGQIMTVRRLADDHSDGPDSLWWVIERMRKNPALVSRPHYVAQAAQRRPDDPDVAAEADRIYTTQHGLGEAPDDGLLLGWQSRLAADASSVVDFADKHVAHRDPRGRLVTVTYGEVHQALDDVAAVANLAASLLNGGSTTWYEYIYITPDWQECLRGGLFRFDAETVRHPDPRGYV